ncbi:hypothetical protein JYT26_02745 [Beggiatoa alba]|nr:hypothetical protein [Beggiatoa alba]
MKTHLIITAGFCFALGTMTAVASEALTFEDIDINGDGFISKTEAMAYQDMSNNWTSVDTNRDGRADISEFSRFEAAESYAPMHDPDEPEPGAAPL